MKTDSFFPLPSSCVTFHDTIHVNLLSVSILREYLLKMSFVNLRDMILRKIDFTMYMRNVF